MSDVPVARKRNFACEGGTAAKQIKCQGTTASSAVVKLPSAIRWVEKPRAVLGVVLIATDFNDPHEGVQLLTQLPRVDVQFGRIAFNSDLICEKTYRDALDNGEIGTAFRSIARPANRVTVQGIACTSMSFILGRERLAREALPGVPMITMWEAVCAALRQLNVTSVGVITPYIAEVHAKNVELLNKDGFSVVRSMHFDCQTDAETDLVDTEFIAECAVSLTEGSKLDAVFLGCSAMRVCTPGYISELEARIGLPVVTSTQAFYWHILRTAKVDDHLEGYGRLFAES